MAITLRIVGIFFKTEVDLGPEGGTVRQVLDAAANAVTAGSSFGYAPRSGSPHTFVMYTESSFPSPTLETQMDYPPGYYVQTESFTEANTPNPYTVWQYYIFDENNVYLNRGKGPIGVDDARVPDKGSVVWRLLSILDRPVIPTGKLAYQLGLPILTSRS